MKSIPFEDKIDMIKSQLKHFEIFQDDNKVFVKIPSMMDLNELSYQGSDILFHTIDEIENDNSVSNDMTVIEIDIHTTNREGLLSLLSELNMLYRKAYDI